MRTSSTTNALVYIYCVVLLLVAPASFAATAPPSGAAVSVPSLGIDVPLPGIIADVAVGGNGRYVLLWLKDVGKVAVFDVSTLKVKTLISIDGTNVVLAANEQKLFVAINDRSILQRWDIATGARELTSMLPDGLEVKQLAISQRAPSALAASMSDKHVAFMDPTTLALRPEKFQNPEYLQTGFSTYGIRAAESADEFAGWIGGANYGRDVFDSRGVSSVSTKWTTDRGGSYYIPSSDGRYVFSEGGVYSNTLKRMDVEAGATLPVYGAPGYFVGLRKLNGDRGNITVSVYTTADRRLLLSMPDGIDSKYLSSEISADKRVVFAGQYNSMILIPATKDHVNVRRFDVVGGLATAGIDYLFVTSLPPTQFTPGSPFSYQVTGFSRQGKVTYALESAPAGMMISNTGLLSWKPAADDVSREQSVVLSIKDGSGQEIYHTFKMTSSTASAQSVTKVAGVPSPASRPAIIDNGPDLTGTWLSLSQDTVGAGKNLQATIVGEFIVENRGKQAAPQSKLRYFLAIDDKAVVRVDDLYESDTVVYHETGIILLQEVLIPPLEPGGKYTALLKAPMDIGDSYIGQMAVAEVNADRRTPEVNTKNNIIKLQIK
ncbi:MAG TPA: hypothetical protein VGK19_20555 [Capsulimonadaceae bacterium]